MEKIERIILRSLMYNSEFPGKTIPFLKPTYFQDSTERLLFETYSELFEKYQSRPTKEALIIAMSEKKGVNQAVLDAAGEVLLEVEKTKDTQNDFQWLLDSTEKFCKDKAVYNAIMESIQILDQKHKTLGQTAIPDLLKDALGVSFDTNVGLDYTQDIEERYEEYHKKEAKVPFDLDILNTITKGGVPSKTLNVLLAGTGVGKSLVLCHMASSYLSLGYNVLYITLELSESKVAERIDANLFNLSIDDVLALPKEYFVRKAQSIAAKTHGRLIIKEFPTASGHVGHFRHTINELNLKKNFVPQILMVDYLSICASSRFKASTGATNSYNYVKAIAEEVRGLAVEKDLRCWTAMQLNRTGFSDSDADLTHTADSFGVPATADFMAALITSEDLEQAGQLMWKQLKSRYNDISQHRRFVVGVDKSKMKLYNVQNADVSVPTVAPSSDAGERTFSRDRKPDKSKFGTLKV